MILAHGKIWEIERNNTCVNQHQGVNDGTNPIHRVREDVEMGTAGLIQLREFDAVNRPLLSLSCISKSYLLHRTTRYRLSQREILWRIWWGRYTSLDGKRVQRAHRALRAGVRRKRQQIWLMHETQCFLRYKREKKIDVYILLMSINILFLPSL